MSHALAAEDSSAFERQIITAGGCSHPVRLRGKVTAVDLATGDTATVYDTASESGGVLHVACGNRRESFCPACSAFYKRDARQLVRAGLVGGKGVPESVAEHPCVFATLTAPGFGPVHSRREVNGKVLPCRPRRDASRRICPHGRDISCAVRHAKDDQRLGRALCGDYRAAVLFNAVAGDLWRPTTYLRRHLARLGGLTQKDFRDLIHVEFVKIAEYQARGVVHFHALIRLDAAADLDPPPGPHWTPSLLCDAVKSAAAQVSSFALVGSPGRGLLLRFGPENDVRPVSDHHGGKLTPAAVANYATKAADAPGLPASRLRSLDEIQALRCSAHHKRMVETPWHLGYGYGAGLTCLATAATSWNVSGPWLTP